MTTAMVEEIGNGSEGSIRSSDEEEEEGVGFIYQNSRPRLCVIGFVDSYPLTTTPGRGRHCSLICVSL